MDTIGQIPGYTEGSNLSAWIERLESFFVVNKIDDPRKVATLLVAMGEGPYELLRNLVAPDKPKDKTYDELVAKLRAHYEPKPLLIAERFRFHRRDQREGESIANFVAELKKLAATCSFGTNLEDSLRDRLVCGLRHDNIQKRLLSEADLTFDRSYTLAIALEAADNQAKELKGGRTIPEPVHYGKGRGKWPPRGGTSGGFKGPGQGSGRGGANNGGNRTQGGNTGGFSGTPCKRCGETNHGPQNCRFKSVTCRGCKKKGHIEKVCRSKGGTGSNTGGRAHFVQEDWDPNEQWLYGPQNGMYHISTRAGVHHTGNDGEPYQLEPVVNGTKLKMEVDTGSFWSLTSRQGWEQIGRPKLKRSEISLTAWANQEIQVLGKCQVQVKIGKHIETLGILVANGDGPNLMGRQWFKALGLDNNIKSALRNLSTGTDNCHFASSHQNPDLHKILQDFKEVFDGSTGAVPDHEVKLHIDPGAHPKFFAPRPVPHALRPKIDRELDRLEAEGIISKVEFSEIAAPIVPRPKPDDRVRICGDFKVTINPWLRADRYPLPKAEDLFAKLRGGQKFTKIDLSNAYQQLVLDEESRKLVTINTHRGLYRYNRLPYGVTPASGIFQRFMEQLVAGISGVCVLVDDILITGSNDEEHLKTLRGILERLAHKGLRANIQKCKFLETEVEYLGHKVDANGLHPVESKVKAIREAPLPQNPSQMRSMLGLVQYYAKFYNGLANLTAPLTDLLRKDAKFHLGPEQLDCIRKIKDAITSEKVLAHYDEKLPVRLACDASAVGIGAVISHVYADGNERPICFASRTLTQAERRYAQIEREALSIIFGVTKFRQYLLGRSFTLITDHQPLVKIFGPKSGIPTLAADRLQRWALILSAFEYDIIYRSTNNHGNADFLSRLPLQADTSDTRQEEIRGSSIFNIQQTERIPVGAATVKKATWMDPDLHLVLKYAHTQWPAQGALEPNLNPFYNRRHEISIEDGVILWGRRVVVPRTLRTSVLRELHVGHPGIVRMKAIARSYCWWPTMDREIEYLAHNCNACQEHHKNPPQGPFIPFGRPTEPWSRIHVDFAGPFLGHMFFILVDSHSKWAEVVPMGSTSAQNTITVLQTLFSRYGLPGHLVSDNGPQFVSSVFRDFMAKNGIRHTLIPPYHPQSNGEAERFVQTFKRGMRTMGATPGTVKQLTCDFLLRYRSWPHSSTGFSPAQTFLKRQIRTHLDLMMPQPTPNADTERDTSDSFPKRLASLGPGDMAYVRNPGNGAKWVIAKIIRRISPTVFLVDMAGRQVKKHLDQISCRVDNAPTDDDPDWPISSGTELQADQHQGPQQVVNPHAPPPQGPNRGGRGAARQGASGIPVPRRYPARRHRPVDRMGL